MKPTAFRRAQRGVTLVIALIMLVVITVMVVSAFLLSTTNLRGAGNMQYREQAIAAANFVIDREIEGSFYLTPATVAAVVGSTSDVDIDNDGTDDFRVTIAGLSCIKATKSTASAVSSVTLPTSMTFIATYDSVWDFNATVADASTFSTGTAVNVHQGIRAHLTQAQCDLVCPPSAGTPCS